MNLQYVIYNNPRDYPNKFVVRRFAIIVDMPLADMEPIGVVNSLHEARALVPVNFDFKMPRLPRDEPQIVEVWMQPEFWKKKIPEILQRKEHM